MQASWRRRRRRCGPSPLSLLVNGKAGGEAGGEGDATGEARGGRS